jgi:teichuronic acid biosynthesis glycosyltransferase TuaC
MRVLFISSGNSKFGISPIVTNQGESLKKQGVKVEYFAIKGRGFKGYLSSIKRLKTYLRRNNYDIVHAHYSLSAIVGSLSGAQNLVVSLMGSDIKSKYWLKFIIWFFHQFFWGITIVKSNEMKKSLGLKEIIVIPNGVDLEVFKPLDKSDCMKKLNWDRKYTHILFAANPNRYEKNFTLANDAINYLNNKTIKLHYLEAIPNIEMPIYFNAADLVLLTSLWEGSPNVIKEAMACNIPIVSTNVGDVKENIDKIEGCYITSFKPEEVALQIHKATTFKKKTTGREHIEHLDSIVIAKKIIRIYREVIINN